RGETPRNLLVTLEVRCLGAKELAQAVVDLGPGDAEACRNRERHREQRHDERKAQRHKADPLDAEGELSEGVRAQGRAPASWRRRPRGSKGGASPDHGAEA